MALVLYGGVAVQVSGSIAGNTHARNRFGNYIRPRTKPVDPATARQLAARTRMSFLTEEWGDTLTAAQRLAWETYAAAIAMSNRLGQTIHPTGFNHFFRANSIALQVGAPVVADGPTTLLLPNADPDFSVALSAASGITITFGDTLDWVDENEGYLVISLGQPQNPTRTFFKSPYRFAVSLQGDDTTPPTTPDGPNAESTWTLIETQLVWVKARILREDGRVSTFFGSGPVTVGA